MEGENRGGRRISFRSSQDFAIGRSPVGLCLRQRWRIKSRREAFSVFVVDRRSACRHCLRGKEFGSAALWRNDFGAHDSRSKRGRCGSGEPRDPGSSATDKCQRLFARHHRSCGAELQPIRCLRALRKRRVSVAVVRGRIVGTASLDGSIVRSVFVDTELRGHGIGK